ncbi:MAG TPA: energy-coupling factor transporter transmembrane component T [Stenomitos sp.]
MDLWAIDRWARRNGPLHRAAPQAKLAGVALALAALSLSTRPEVVGALAVAWFLVVIGTRVPATAALLLIGYAMGFASLYAFLTWEGSWPDAALLVMKAGGAAASVLSLIVTTPYPEVFRALRRWLPPLLVDALLLTYRSIFILLHRWEHLWDALRLRHGFSRRHPVHSARAMAPGLGVLLVGALDRSETLYDAMLLRGYRGRITAPKRYAFRKEDLVPLTLGLLSLALSMGTCGP